MANDDTATAPEIIAIIKGIFTAFEDHDPDGIEGHMHPDSTVWDVFTPQLIRGVEERNKFHAEDQEQMQARGTLTLTVEEPEVDAWADTALARYYINYSYEAPNAAQGRVRITDVFRQIDGKWLIVHHHEGTVPTGIPPITDES
ncbi:MAG: SnoaL-like domain-containing protein [Rhodospirillaceae bacterium]|jgi:ketosteroid isomerase-like protein|nr:SnoaL-like domain-containing protein [Rhodospirillaceae bacterium]MBT5239393.1 SnoaL-like domain-containing protein [Rhodospirillaceae bacterium]MBT5564236.1 SnoaL-like domain-containing protein [Rhodospirillaceae bacterium]MBT6088801.1 SnoaL-like domain-containing protein [Rhodospirillaceae bacterium]MBT6961165.1 SnoaL-like domain-containing protein [Rhodospirillaceae bacterium]